ncbi:ribosomal protein S18-alanine N-acetyltransferase [Marinobacter sp. C2H3]|uniref:ribosomal protein S18-alanine N-acetyltransferase n=1 Tax=Marinobacter sp. C2H3 TaxID=3119003 RepID=UPI00300F66C2
MSRDDVYAAVLQAELVIRPLAPVDVPQVLELERQGYPNPWSEAVFLDCFRDNYQLWALCRGDRLCGYAIVALQLDEAHLLNLCVAPNDRRSGLGRRLLRHLMAHATAAGAVKVILEVRASNQSAAALYASEGFVQIGLRRGYYPGPGNPEDAIVMVHGAGSDPL